MKKILALSAVALIIAAMLTGCAELMFIAEEAIDENYGDGAMDEMWNGIYEYQDELDSLKYELYDELESQLDLLEEVLTATEAPVVTEPPVPFEDLVVLEDIPEDQIANKESLTMSEFHPFIGLTNTMLQQNDPLDDEPPTGTETAADVFSFVTDWLNNSTEVTRINVTTSEDGTVNIDYGQAIELPRSGKHTTLANMIQQNEYDNDPTIIFRCDEEADKRIREWFGLDGDGTYSMYCEFGRVYIDDPGYRIIIEDGVVYQVPIIHEDTTMKVYYREKDGKQSEVVLDAADVLRNTKIKMDDAEAEKLLNRLREYGYID